MKTLTEFLKEYLYTRRALGYQLKRAEYELKNFLKFLEKNKSPIITQELALDWATHFGTATQKNGAQRLGIIRQFAKYLKVEDGRHDVPSEYLAPNNKSARRPVYIYSSEEILNLMNATPIFKDPLIVKNYYTLIGLLAATGIRIGELIALNDCNFDAKNSFLLIDKGKGIRQRKVLLHCSTVKMLKLYQDFKKQVVVKKDESFFLSKRGTRLNYENIHPNFDKLLRKVNLYNKKPKPRIHDIRHTFIIKTIARWYHEEKNVEAQLIYLSNYVGHISPSSTYWYLSATPELMACAAARQSKKMESWL